MEAVTAGLNSLHWHWHGIFVILPRSTQISWDLSDLGSSHYVIGLSAQLQKSKLLIPFPGKRRLPIILWCHIPGIPSELFIHFLISIYTIPTWKSWRRNPWLKTATQNETARDHHLGFLLLNNLNECDHRETPLQFNHQISFYSYMVGKQFVFLFKWLQKQQR